MPSGYIWCIVQSTAFCTAYGHRFLVRFCHSSEGSLVLFVSIMVLCCLSAYALMVTYFPIQQGIVNNHKIQADHWLVLLLYVPSQQLWSLRDGQFT